MSEPTHIERIPVDMTVDERGNIAWNPIYRDYNETVFHRGKTVTNDEFNDLHKKSAYQSNYLTDSLKALLGEHLNSAIVRNITTRTNSIRSYVKPFVSTDWGELQQDGYYYINIPVTEHGLTPNADAEVLERMNIKAQMYLLDSNNNFYEVQQVEIDTQNNVTIYTDDNTLSGFVIIGINDKTYTLIDESINANLITGLADVAMSGDYNDLINTPDARITALENTVATLTAGTTAIAEAAHADTADKLLSTSLIQGVPVSSIFETGSNYVKKATNATRATEASWASLALYLRIYKHVNQYHNYIPTISDPGLYVCTIRNRSDNTEYTVMLSINDTNVTSVGVGAFYDGTYEHGVCYNPNTRRIEIYSSAEDPDDVFTIVNVRDIIPYSHNEEEVRASQNA